ncbi:MAG TPA: acyltransferase family protein, partial [Microthrixaceae bacterium]|nr:acyltransferase family protein [Microthrixaceae bacterium]
MTDTPDVADEHPAPPPSIGTLPGLTGLRGIAVVAVVAYHLGYLPGGFVGVDLFFVLSGFLITSLLMSRPPVGAAGLRRWWARRVRRLTPAVAVVVLAVLALFLTRSGIALDAVATMTWWQNWHLIAEGTSYWYEFSMVAGGHSSIISDAKNWPPMKGKKVGSTLPKRDA